MASTTSHTIVLQGGAVRREDLANVALTPGELLRVNANEKLEPHGAAGGVLVGKLFALESPTAPPGITEAIDEDYAVDDIVYYAEAQPGDVVYAFLAAGETAVKGVTQLQSDGAGALQAETVDATTLANSIVGVPAEDVDNSGGGTRVRLRVRVL